MVASTDSRPPASARGAGRRVRDLALVGLAGAGLAAGGTAFWQRASARSVACVPDPAEVFSCLGGWPFQLLLGVPVLGGTAALALFLAGVRRVVPVVLVGGVLTLLLLQFYETGVAGTPPPPLWLGTLLGLAGFTLAVPLVGAGWHWAVRVGVALALLAPLPLLPSRDAASTLAQRRAALSSVQVPLWLPEVSGYPLQGAYPVRDSTAFAARLAPHWDPVRDRREIRSVVLPVPSDFSPPAACGPHHWQVTSDGHFTSEPCQRLDTGDWRRVDLDSIEYVLRRDDVLIVVSADSRAVPEADLALAVANLRLATVDELAAKP